MKNLRLRPGQRREVNPHHPQNVREANLKNEELKNFHKADFEAGKIIDADTKAMSARHIEHGEALLEVDRTTKVIADQIRSDMSNPKYTGHERAEGVDPVYVTWIDSRWGALYPDTEMGDLMPSSGKSLHDGV